MMTATDAQKAFRAVALGSAASLVAALVTLALLTLYVRLRKR